jgi:hypothetical protein
VQVVFLDPDQGVRVTLSLPFDAAVLSERGGQLPGHMGEGAAATADVSVEGSGAARGLAAAIEAAVAAVPPEGPVWLREACLAVHGAMMQQQQPLDRSSAAEGSSAPLTFRPASPKQAALGYPEQAAVFGGERRTLMRTPIKAIK